MAYGYITSTNEYKKQLKDLNRNYEGRRVWDELYGQIGLSKQLAESTLNQDYSTNVLDAYSEAYNQRLAIANSALGTGYKQQAMEDLDFALSEAFDSYRQNYLTQKAQIDENALAANQAIDAELTKQAKNIKLYQDSFYNYLDDLWNRAQGTGKYEDIGVNTTLQNLFINDPLWSRYTEKIDKNTHLLDSSSLYAQLYDANHMITDKGRDFYDQMFNSLGVVEGKDYSFHRYLSEVNPELYDWSIASNPYDYTEAGTNMGTFKTLMGLDSKDNEYKFIERNSGLTKADVEVYLNKFAERFKNLDTSGKYKKSKNNLTIFNEAVGDLTKYVNSLDINASKKSELVNSINNYAKTINVYNLEDTDAWEAISAFRQGWQYGKSQGGLGTKLVNGLFSFVGGMLDVDDKSRKERKQDNQAYTEKLKSDYLDLLTYISYEVTKK